MKCKYGTGIELKKKNKSLVYSLIVESRSFVSKFNTPDIIKWDKKEKKKR